MTRKKTRKPKADPSLETEPAAQEAETPEAPEPEPPVEEEAISSEPAVEPLIQEESLEDRLKALERRLETVQDKYQNRVIADGLRTAYLEQGGLPSSAETAVLAMRAGAGDAIRLDQEGNPVFVKPGGEPLFDDDGLRLTPESFVRLWLAKNPIFLRPDSRQGSGSSPSEPSETSAQEILRRIRSAKSPDDILKLAASLGLK